MKHHYLSLKPVHLRSVKTNFCGEYWVSEMCKKIHIVSVPFISIFLKMCKMGDLVKGIYSLHSLLIENEMHVRYLIVRTEAYQACAYLVTAV